MLEDMYLKLRKRISIRPASFSTFWSPPEDLDSSVGDVPGLQAHYEYCCAQISSWNIVLERLEIESSSLVVGG